jgi:hypothetical protein
MADSFVSRPYTVPSEDRYGIEDGVTCEAVWFSSMISTTWEIGFSVAGLVAPADMSVNATIDITAIRLRLSIRVLSAVTSILLGGSVLPSWGGSTIRG